MRKFIFIICMLSFACSHGQELTVKSFKVKNNDLAASTNERKDNNGNSCALIKVQLATAGAKFEPNVIGSVEYKINEYWVFLPTICKHLKIKHPNYLTKDIVFSEYGINSLESKTTYELVISIPDGTPAPQLVTSQYLIFKVNPSDAVVEVNDEIWTNNEGVARKFVPFGEYKYSIQSKDYHMASGIVSVQDPENKVTVNIDLKPAFGAISIPSQKNLEGATIYIDNKLAGLVPLTVERIPSGEHSIRIAKSLYKSFESTAIVKDGEITTINPELHANFSVVTLNVDNNAEIWINDEKKGEGSWTGNLESGDYKIETRKTSHRSKSETYTIQASKKTETIKLNAPTPIYGSVNIMATPDGSRIYMDGKDIGETPMFLQQVLIGQHSIIIEKEGYSPNTQNIDVIEGKTTELNCQLSLSNKHNDYQSNIEEWIKLSENFCGKYDYKKKNKERILLKKISISKVRVDISSRTLRFGKFNHIIFKSKDGSIIIKYNELFGFDFLINNQMTSATKISDYIYELDLSKYGTDFYIYSYQDFCILNYIQVLLSPSNVEKNNIEKVNNTNTLDQLNAPQKITITANGVPFNMIKVEGGNFIMGRVPDMALGFEVTLTNDYYIGEMEVTQKLWVAVMGSNPTSWKGNDLPVAEISWNDCQVFIKKLNEITGREFRLPTSAEWEFAAHGGNKSKGYIYSGSNNLEKVAVLRPSLQRGGTKEPNELGIYDMSGNVAEYCNDWVWDFPYNYAGINPTGPSSGNNKVLRGGDFDSDEWSHKVTSIMGKYPTDNYGYCGLRLAL